MKSKKPDAEWQATLSPEAYRITRQHGTERPFTHNYNVEKRDGVYHCVCCGEPLFDSAAKYDSGSGWPSYTSPVSEDAVMEHEDNSLFRSRTEIRCASCDAHLGHVFSDGPQPTGLRYCINGGALDFKSEEEA
ncbi:MAG: peptide-methionine (R)-S-oxide reductase [Hyphomicrobiales bacterium]|nr:MAG: peptide-methionine (R)-S-oxide reductase [Hyphomicrobiales bacterium]